MAAIAAEQADDNGDMAIQLCVDCGGFATRVGADVPDGVPLVVPTPPELRSKGTSFRKHASKQSLISPFAHLDQPSPDVLVCACAPPFIDLNSTTHHA